VTDSVSLGASGGASRGEAAAGTSCRSAGISFAAGVFLTMTIFFLTTTIFFFSGSSAAGRSGSTAVGGLRCLMSVALGFFGSSAILPFVFLEA
jgi:hypothetical protein